MKVIKIRVAPHIAPGTPLIGQYVKDGDLFTLLQSGIIKKGKLGDEERPFTHFFSKENRELVYSWDWSEPKTDYTKGEIQRQKKIKEFWENHTQINPIGKNNPNLIDARFVMEAVDEVNAALVSEIKRKNSVCNIINNMSPTQRRDICFYFGNNVVGKNDDEIFLLLCDFNGGLVMNEANSEELFKITSGVNYADIELKTYLQKAVALGIIKNDNSRYYTSGGELIGISFDDIYSYYKMNESLAKFLYSAVDREDKYIKADGTVAKKEEKLIQSTKDEREDLEKRAKDLDVPNYQTMDLETLKKRVGYLESVRKK